MPSFRVIPTDDPLDFIDFDGVDASSALNVTSARKIEEADVYRDGEYVFSLRQGSKGGCWVIHTKCELAAPLLEDVQLTHKELGNIG